ncbi:hypothetical protein [Candidatus Palauibacter sp.]|uniref:hypothetical protein n=1 Tax=Candidatus Palauibacter sp. TaxID=3101350 RepID=UPI003B01938E
MYRSSCHPACTGVVALLLVTAGCGSEGGPVAAGLDSPDIPLAPDVEEMYTVGVLDGAPWEMFGSVRAVAFDEDGTLFILDSDAGHIVAIDPGGGFVRTISGKGEGPGELNQPIGMAVFSDGGIGVNDLTRGIQFFSREGEFLREAAFDMMDGAPGVPIYALPDGTVLSAELVGGSLARLLGGDDAVPEGRPIHRYRLDGTRELFYAAWPGPPGEETEMRAGNVRLVMSGAEPFPLPLAVGVLRDGRVVVADSVGYRIKILDASGRVTRTLERSLAPVAVTEAIREAERERRLATARSVGGGGNTVVMMGRLSEAVGSVRGGGGVPRGPDPDMIRRMLEDQIRDLAFPDEIPLIANLAVDWSDRIWVQRSALPGETGPTDILTADGQYFGTIAPDGLRIPNAFGPDGLLAYIDTDELGIQRVRVVRLVGDQLLETAGED